MRDEEKPRRPKADELADIRDFIRDFESRRQVAVEEKSRWAPPTVNPNLSLGEIVARMEAEEEEACQARERAETPEERKESLRILRVEAEIEAEIPLLRLRKLRKTFSRPKLAYAATAPD
ncbi:MAG TPA: hypothetical protein VF176_09095 [Solirubrobacterales bacterium]